MTRALRNVVLLASMLAASGLAVALRPTERLADHGAKVDLERMIPRQFGEWQVDDKVVYQQVSPETTAALNKIYTQVLTRTYVNGSGYRIMLSVPYGANQSDGLAAHDPEGCYPAQGFQILSKSKADLPTARGPLPVRRMEAQAGNRHELVTYWFTVGAYAVNNDWARKKAQFHYALQRQVADGLLIRASSIDPDNNNAYVVQQQFIGQLLDALTPADRARVGGRELAAR
ncbi:exosortase-associated protein EpsI, B-type [Oxalobacteraceae bacterium A2-2]